MYLNKVRAAKRRDPQLQKIRFEVQQSQSWDFIVDNEGTLQMGTKLCVLDVHKLRKEILSKCFTC